MANLDEFFGGYSAGNQMAEQGRNQRNRALVQNLAPQIIGGDPQAFVQAASVDPQAATGLQQSGEGLIRRTRGAAQFLQKALQGGNQVEIAAARRTIKPYMDTLKPGTQYPLDMDPAQESAGIQSFLAETQMYDPRYNTQGGGVQSTYIDGEGNRVAIMRDGSTQILGRNDAGANQQALNIDVNGVPTQVTFDRRTGRYSNAALGPMQQPQAQIPQQADMEGDIALANQMIAAGIPDTQVDAFLSQRGQRAQQMDPQAGVPIVGRRKEDEAAAVEQARSNVQLANLPAELGMRTSSAIQQAAGIEQAKSRVEQQQEAIQNLPRVVQESDNTIRLIQQALNHPGLSVATGLQGRLDPRNYLPGTDASNFRVLLDQIKGGTFLQAFQSLKGGGAITEVEGRKAEQAIARLDTAQSEEAFRQALGELAQIANNAKERAIRKASSASSQRQPTQQAPQRARNPQTGEVIELRNGQWVPVR